VANHERGRLAEAGRSLQVALAAEKDRRSRGARNRRLPCDADYLSAARYELDELEALFRCRIDLDDQADTR